MSSRPMVDGEYDPVVAAANRAAAERRARETRERLRLQTEAAAKKAKAAADAKAAEAKRIADLKAKQAETAATLERTRLSAEKRAQAAAQRAQDRTEKKATQAKVSSKKPIMPSQRKPATIKDIQQGILRVGSDYENVFKSVTDPLVQASEKASKRSLELALEGKPWAGFGAYATGTTIRTAKGVVEGASFLVRPAAWARTAEFIGQVLMPEKGESQSDYRSRLSDMVKNDVYDESKREQILDKLVSTMPRNLVSREDRQEAKEYRKALGASIMADPVGFVSEVTGGIIGGKLALKALSKVSGIKELVSRPSLEQRMWDKITPIEKIGTTVPEVHTPSNWSPTTMPRGMWRSTWEIARDVSAKGGTAIVMLKNPTTGELMGFMSWEEAVAVTGGLPELLGSLGVISGIEGKVVVEPVVVEDSKLKQSGYLDTVQRLTKEELAINQPVSIETIEEELKKLDKEDEGVGVVPVVIPDIKQKPPIDIIEDIVETVTEELDQTVIEDIDETVIEDVIQTVIEDLDQTVIDETVVEEIVETVTEELEQAPTKPPTPPKLKKGDPGMRPNVFRALVGGLKEKYRVVFDYPKGKNEAFTVTARSFPQALSQATQLRRVKYVPSEVDIAKSGKG